MKILATTIIVGSILVASAHAQQEVTLKITRVDNLTPEAVLITLASGKTITVPASDVVRADTVNESENRQQTTSAIPPDPKAIITAKCQQDWAGDFRMQAFCVKQQTEAHQALVKRSMDTTDQKVIRAKCASDWKDDFRMWNFCETQQLEALAKLR